MLAGLSSALVLSTGAAFLQEPSAEGPRWRIGLTARRVQEVPAEDVLGDKRAYRFAGPPVFDVLEDAGAVAVHVHRSDGYSSDSIRLRLSSEGAEAEASSASCVHQWADVVLGGTACVVTDGTRAAVDFELYDGAAAVYAQAFFGRVQLGPAGVTLAESLLARDVAAEPLRLVTLVHTPDEGPFARERRTYASHGSVDGFGRRQGLWTVRETGTGAVLEMSWRDGRPHGIYRASRGESQSVGGFEMGFEDGQHVVWHGDGERRVMHFVAGLADGVETLYDAEGRRRIEWARSGNDERRREWSEDGRLIADEPVPGTLGDPAARRRSHAAYREWIGGLHTRRGD